MTNSIHCPRHGGSALFFADLLYLNGARGHVISIDVDPRSNQVGQHPYIDFLYGDSGSREMAELVGKMLPLIPEFSLPTAREMKFGFTAAPNGFLIKT